MLGRVRGRQSAELVLAALFALVFLTSQPTCHGGSAAAVPMQAPETARKAATPRRVERVAPRVDVGPVPDYAPLLAVASHAHADEFAPELSQTLRAVPDVQHIVFGTAQEDGGRLWLRDYHPIFVRRADGTLKLVHYLPVPAERDGFTASLDLHAPARASGPQWFPTPGVGAGGRWLDVEHLPLVHENGNLVVAGRFVFTTEHLLEANTEDYVDEHLVEHGYVPRSAEQVLAMMAAALEVERDAIVVLPMMPGEETGHIDMFLMALGPDHVLIPKLLPEAVEAADEPLRPAARRAREFLDDQAIYLESLGLTVSRLPMLPPVVEEMNASEPELIWLSPSNGILVNTGKARSILLPIVDDSPLSTGLHRMATRYLVEWIKFFEAQGWKPRLVNAWRLSEGFGLLRCATAAIPR